MGAFLLVTGNFVKTGGMDRCNYALAAHLAKKRHEVHLVAYRVAEDLLRYPNIVFHRVPLLAKSYLLSAWLLNLIGRHWAALITGRGGRVLVNGGSCKWNDINWVHHVHAADRPWGRGRFSRRTKSCVSHRIFLGEERAIVPLARLILATCERVKRDIIELLGIRADRIHVVHLGIDAELFRPITPQERIAIRSERGWDQSKPVLMFIGALGDDRKGFDTLFAAWEILCRDPEWDGHLAVVGQGAGLPDWKKKTARSGLDNRIEFLGFVKGLPSALAACDALVLPSRYEGYSLVTQEALCCGLPAFVSRSAGIADRYPAELQRLIIPDPNDPEDLAHRLRLWRCDMEQYKMTVSSFSAELRAHTWEVMAEQILEVITSGNP